MSAKYLATTLFIISFVLLNLNIFSAIIEGTLVKTSYGLVPVENLNIGEKVVSCDCKRSVITEANITRICYSPTKTIIKVETDSEILYASAKQFFYEPNLHKWIKAENLSTENILIDCDFNYYKIYKIERIGFNTRVYRLSLEFPHTFFAHNSQILVHNYGHVIQGGYRFLVYGLEALKAIARNPAVFKQTIKAGAVAVGAAFAIRDAKQKTSRCNSKNQKKKEPLQHKNSSLGHRQRRTAKKHQKMYRKFFKKRAKNAARQARLHHKKQKSANKSKSKSKNSSQGDNRKNNSYTPNNNDPDGPDDLKNAKPGKAPGKPTEADGFKPSKGKVGNGGRIVRHPLTGQYGWKDAKGNIWVPTGKGPLAHGGPHWDVIDVKGRHVGNKMPGGKWR